MASFADIPVFVENADGTETMVSMAEAVKMGLFKDGIKVEVQGTGIVKNPESKEGSEA